MKNIGIVTTWFERGAAYVSRQFKEILELENSVYVYARGGEEYAKGNKVWDTNEVHWGTKIDSPFAPTSINKKDFIKWIKLNKIEIVIFNEQHWFEPLLWCKDLGLRTIGYIDYYTEDTVPLFNIYDALICNTKRHFSVFKNHNRAYYIPWGTDVELFKPISFEYSLVNKDYVTFFHSAGMLGIRKGTDLLIKAFSATKENSKLIIHTQTNLTNIFPELEITIKELVNNKRLEIINKTIPAPGLYYKGDVYVYPTRLEGIGLTIAESISSGLACIVPKNAPMDEFVNDSFGRLINISQFTARADGYYWPKCEIEVDDLTKIIDHYAANPELVMSHKENARLYAINNLNYKDNFKLLNHLVNTIEYIPCSDILRQNIIKYERRGMKKFQHLYLSLYPLMQILRYIIKRSK